ncbi:MAG: GNAT family N-acetyltransferase [Paraclostridium sp.]
MREVILKDGRKVVIRKAVKDDAQDMIDYLNKIGGESDFLTFGENQFKITLEVERDYIVNANISDNSIVVVATINDKIVSIGSINSTKKERTKHNGVLGISIRKSFWGIGLGSVIMEYLISWANSNGITKRIELLVREDNDRAIKLYEKYGFDREGLLKWDMCVDNVYYNTIMMALYI